MSSGKKTRTSRRDAYLSSVSGQALPSENNTNPYAPPQNQQAASRWAPLQPPKSFRNAENSQKNSDSVTVTPTLNHILNATRREKEAQSAAEAEERARGIPAYMRKNTASSGEDSQEGEMAVHLRAAREKAKTAPAPISAGEQPFYAANHDLDGMKVETPGADTARKFPHPTRLPSREEQRVVYPRGPKENQSRAQTATGGESTPPLTWLDEQGQAHHHKPVVRQQPADEMDFPVFSMKMPPLTQGDPVPQNQPETKQDAQARRMEAKQPVLARPAAPEQSVQAQSAEQEQTAQPRSMAASGAKIRQRKNRPAEGNDLPAFSAETPSPSQGVDALPQRTGPNQAGQAPQAGQKQPTQAKQAMSQQTQPKAASGTKTRKKRSGGGPATGFIPEESTAAVKSAQTKPRKSRSATRSSKGEDPKQPAETKPASTLTKANESLAGSATDHNATDHGASDRDSSYRSAFFQNYVSDVQQSQLSSTDTQTTPAEAATAQPVFFPIEGLEEEWQLPVSRGLTDLFPTADVGNSPAFTDSSRPGMGFQAEPSGPQTPMSQATADSSAVPLESILMAGMAPFQATPNGEAAPETSEKATFAAQADAAAEPGTPAQPADREGPSEATRETDETEETAKPQKPKKKRRRYSKLRNLIYMILSLVVGAVVIFQSRDLLQLWQNNYKDVQNFKQANEGATVVPISLLSGTLASELLPTTAPAAEPEAASVETASAELPEGEAETGENVRSVPNDYESRSIIREELTALRNSILVVENNYDVANNDVKGWIDIPGILDKAAFVQSSSNSTYVYTDEHRKGYQKAGAIFVDYRCDVSNPTENLLVYGSIYVNGKCFAPLKAFMKELAAGEESGRAFVNQHALAEVLLPYEMEQYHLVAIKEVNRDQPEKVPVTFATDSDMMDFVHWFCSNQDGTVFLTGTDIQPSDRLMTLAATNSQDPTFMMLYRMRRETEPVQDMNAAAGVVPESEIP